MRSTPRHRLFVGVVGVLLLALGIVWFGQQIHVRLLSRGVEQRQQQQIVTARELIRSEFENTQMAMQVIASEVIDIASNQILPFDHAPSASMIQSLGAIQLSEHWSVSVYDGDVRLIAWQGERIPLAIQPTLDRPQWGIARDEEWRIALVLWEPLIKEDAVIGSVCVTQNLYSRAPVRNAMLRDYNIVDTWQQRTGLDIQVAFGDTLGDQALRSLDGQPLGTYTVTPPSQAKLITATSTFYGNLIALCVVLLTLWFLWGTWRWMHSHLSLLRLVAFTSALIGGRFALLYLDVPARYQIGKAPLSPLFDPVHLASTIGGGFMQTTGDLLISAVCIFILGVAAIRYANAYSKPFMPHQGGTWARLGFSVATSLLFATVLMSVIHAAVLDSTLSYTGRSVLIPSSLELVVYASLILFTLGVLLIVSSGLKTAFKRESDLVCLGVTGLAFVLGIILLDQLGWCSWILSLSLMIVSLCAALWATREGLFTWLTVRRAVPATLVLCLLIYPVYYDALNQRKQERVAYAVSTFDQTGLPSVSLAVREVVEEARLNPQLRELPLSADMFESEAEKLLSGSLLSSLGTYDASMTYLSSDREEIHSYGSFAQSSEDIRDLVEELSAEIQLQETSYTFIEPQSSGAARYQYAGLAAMGDGWVLVRAQPHIVSEEANTPLLRILLSSGYLDLYEDLSLASYSNGLLMRTFGDRFAKYRLDPDVESELVRQQSVWRQESVGEGRSYLTYYLQRDSHVVAARIRIDGPFDHLYYLLRLVVGGLLLCIPFCLVGYVLRWRAGLIPPKRYRYQDKVLTAFLLVGVVAVIPVGIAGYSVVTEENEKAVQSWLRQHLERVESTLAPNGRMGENSIDALERSNIDSLAARVGLDLNLYRDTQLIAASRRQLVDDRIVDVRLPAEVFRAIYGNAERFTFVDHKLGDFEYTAGYRAILDANGDPAYIISVPNLPEAERIAEERARTLAYLFGALLGLGILVMFTGSVLARALARPIARLQQGMEEAAQGKFERVLPVESRDEIGALVTTFNTMQGQLSESRKKLAKQQRQLAWREMARQIAHEIKNPLTPMKLSIQHLQRSLQNKDDSRFKKLFMRTTATLVEQIDSLAHIANEFSSFAQLPRRKVVHLDLRTVLSEAYTLMKAEASEEVMLELQLPDTPLLVRGDPNELRRTYINIIKNAFEAVSDQDTMTIMVSARQDENQIITEVTDNGRGIPEEVRDQIFEPSFSTKTSGAGLGLAIARQAVELSGGRIRFTTQLEKGTTMQITLPWSQEEE